MLSNALVNLRSFEAQPAYTWSRSLELKMKWFLFCFAMLVLLKTFVEEVSMSCSNVSSVFKLAVCCSLLARAASKLQGTLAPNLNLSYKRKVAELTQRPDNLCSVECYDVRSNGSQRRCGLTSPKMALPPWCLRCRSRFHTMSHGLCVRRSFQSKSDMF
eukprot:2679423-Amphidinium_carterae.1